jgi:hypothetical protein
MTKLKWIVGVACIGCIASLCQMVEPTIAMGEEENTSQSDFELMRSDIRTKKATMIADRMKFTDQEAAAFWPVYRQYETDLAAINDKKVSIMKDYMQHHESLNDKQAKQLADDVFEVDRRTLDLRTKCFNSLEKVLPAKTIVRWLQLERRLQLLVDAQIAQNFPAIKK